MDLEWDEAKNQYNIAKHGIDFSDAHRIFTNPIVVRSDERHEYGEQRWIALARIIHERFCCKRKSAAATSLSASGLAARSLNVLFKYASAPRRSARWSRNAAPRFRDEPS